MRALYNGKVTAHKRSSLSFCDSWIADGERGLIIGASLNKIGGKIFFVDELSRSDVKAVLDEVDEIVGTCA